MWYLPSAKVVNYSHWEELGGGKKKFKKGENMEKEKEKICEWVGNKKTKL